MCENSQKFGKNIILLVSDFFGVADLLKMRRFLSSCYITSKRNAYYVPYTVFLVVGRDYKIRNIRGKA